VRITWLALGLLCVTACASPHRDPIKKDAGVSDTEADSGSDNDTSSAVDAGASGDTGSSRNADTAPSSNADTAPSSNADTATATDTATADAGPSDAQAADTHVDGGANGDAGQGDSGAADAGSVDAGGEATACFVGGPPAPGAKILDVPKGKTTCPSFDKPFIGLPGTDYGKPTLTVEPGVLDDKHEFVPYKNGDFIPIRPGAQPGFHVWTAFRVTVPGATSKQVKLEVLARGLMDCEAKAFGALPTYYATQDPKLPNTYVYKTTLAPGLPTIFANTTVGMAGQFCGKWLDLRVQVLQQGTKNWGKSQVLLRIWDGVTKN